MNSAISESFTESQVSPSFTDAAPPHYQPNEDNGPPMYRHTQTERLSARPCTDHVCYLMNSKNTPWATMKLQSAARSSEDMPVFLESDVIIGTFELNVNSEHIVEIALVVTGRILTSVHDYNSNIFLNLSKVIWSRTMGDPRSSTSSATVAPYKGKLHGNYSWPFRLALPRNATLMPGPRTFILPPTFLEKNIKASVQYDLYIEIRRGRFRLDSKLGTMIAYVPCIQPEPPSSLRQLAYQEGTPVLGPDVDPDGWELLQPVYIDGTIFRDRPVRVKCTLSLAKPLCYTRGTSIPCVLIIETPDEQALDLLSSPRSAVVRLQRRIVYSTDDKEAYRTNKAGVHMEEAVDYPTSSVWWPVLDGGQHRRLDGEIHLPKHMKPSCAVMDFSITYCVTMFPFEAVAFSSANTEHLLTQEVEIGTHYAKGPRAKTYSPPVYSPSPKPSGFLNFPCMLS